MRSRTWSGWNAVRRPSGIIEVVVVSCFSIVEISTVVSPADGAAEGPAILQCNGGDAVVRADDRARIDDVFKQVVEVAAAGASEVRADLAAFAVERVARTADAGVKLAALF